MHTDMEYRVLGVVEVHAGPARVPLSGKQRSLLAALLLHPGPTVGNARLVDAVWGRPLPAAPEARLRTLVSQLRRSFARVRRAPIVTRPSGYLLDLGSDRLDLRMFHSGVEQARAHTDSRPQTAIARYDEALALWRGPALGGTDGPFAEGEAARLEELRMSVREERVGVLLDLGRCAEAVDELGHLVAGHPLRERLHAQLMLALHRSGRRGEALEVYRRLRDRLVAELGIEPMAEVRWLQQAILADDPDLVAAAGVRLPME